MTVAVVLLAALTMTAGADAKSRHRYLPVRCDDNFRNVIEQTGQQLIAQYNAMGFDIGSPSDVTAQGYPADGAVPGEACGYVGTKHLKGGVSVGVREGNGFMADVRSAGEPPFPGETNPAIDEYDWKWKELVTRTKKGKLYGTIEQPIHCEKSSGSYDGGDLQIYPC